MLIRGFAEAADRENIAAYYGSFSKSKDLYCRYSQCPAHRDHKSCVQGLSGTQLVKHHQDKHGGQPLFRCYVKECPKYTNVLHGWIDRNAFIKHIKSVLKKFPDYASNRDTALSASNNGLVPSDAGLHQQQHLHTVGNTLQSGLQQPGEQWHENNSRDLAERHIAGNEDLYGKQRIIFIRAFARAADFEQRTAYWGLQGVTHQHCREDNCRAHKHEGPVCKTGLTMDDLIVHYDKEHRGTFLFRCYVDICKSYHEPTHGWNNKSNLVAHVRNENKKKTGLTDPPGPLI